MVHLNSTSIICTIWRLCHLLLFHEWKTSYRDNHQIKYKPCIPKCPWVCYSHFTKGTRKFVTVTTNLSKNYLKNPAWRLPSLLSMLVIRKLQRSQIIHHWKGNRVCQENFMRVIPNPPPPFSNVSEILYHLIVDLRLGWLTVLSSRKIVEQELHFLVRVPLRK